MDEERRVDERLERIEALRRRKAPSSALLAEVRGLLREGEALLAAEWAGSGRAVRSRASRATAAGSGLEAMPEA